MKSKKYSDFTYEIFNIIEETAATQKIDVSRMGACEELCRVAFERIMRGRHNYVTLRGLFPAK